MVKKKKKSQKLPAFGEETGYSKNMKAACIKHADNNFLFELALKHVFCDNPSPTATEDLCRDIRVRVISLLVENAVKNRNS